MPFGALHARDAIERGATALADQDRTGAARWFERARRLAPDDPTALYLLSSAVAGNDPSRAIALLLELLRAVPAHRSARISLAALLHRQGRHAEAAMVLHRLLSSMAVPQDDTFRSLADRVAYDAAHAGWIGITQSGRLLCTPLKMAIRLDDGRRLNIAGPEALLTTPWRQASYLHASVKSGRLLGCAIDLRSVTLSEGVVDTTADGYLTGWASTPNDPDADILIEVFWGDDTVPTKRFIASDRSKVLAQGNGAQLAAGFRLKMDTLRIGAKLRVHANGRALHGSPVMVHAETLAVRTALKAATDPWRPLHASLIGRMAAPHRCAPERGRIAVVLPLYKNVFDFEHCLGSLLAQKPALRIIAIDDGIPDPALRESAGRAQARGEIELLTHPHNIGFPAAANTGLRHAAGWDVVLLNTDTLLPPGAIERLADAAYADAHTGTVTPLTTDGTMTDYRWHGQTSAMPSASELLVLDTAARSANAGLHVPIPTCVGFCIYMRRDCLAETGLFHEEAFGQGYGEENDWSLRAAHLGWAHVAACDVVVAHAGGHSFGAQRAERIACNLRILNRLHPGYDVTIADFLSRDTLRRARLAIAISLWLQGRKRGSVLLVTHDSGGGVERHVAGRVAAIRQVGLRAIVIRPHQGYAVSDGCDRQHSNLVLTDIEHLADLLRQDKPESLEFHHTASHMPDIERLPALLAIPFSIVVHDFAAICPRVTLCDGRGRYCGEPADVQDCEDCIVDNGARIPDLGGRKDVGLLRLQQAAHFALAHRVIVPSIDAARRMRRYFPGRCVEVTAWDDVKPTGVGPPRPRQGALKIVVLGGIGDDKGFSVLLACARDARRPKPAAQLYRRGSHDRRWPASRYRRRVHNRTLRGGRGAKALERDIARPRLPAVRMAGNLVLCPFGFVAVRTARGRIQPRRAGGTH